VSPIDGALRRAIGASLEATVDLSAAWYARRGAGVFVRNHVPTKVVARPNEAGTMQKIRVATGTALVDFSGHIVLGAHVVGDEIPGALAGWTKAGQFLPCYFDLKGFSGAGHASYKHERDALHQVDFLLERQRDGVFAGLVLIDDTAERCWVISQPDHLRTLQGGGSVPVCARRGRRDFSAHYLPNCGRTPDGSRTQPPGYDFVALFNAIWWSQYVPIK